MMKIIKWVSSQIKGLGFNGLREYKIIMLGLDAAGKTTILYKLKLGEIVTTIPTIGFNLESLEYKNIKMHCWDVGGCDKIRPLWRHYTDGLEALIYVIDTNDRERISEAANEFEIFVKEFGPELPYLVFYNKRDLPNCMQVEEVTDKMNFAAYNLKNFHAQESIAFKGDGLYDGFDWLSEKMNELYEKKKKTDKDSSVTSKPTAAPTPEPSKTAPPAPPKPPFLSPSDSLTNKEFLEAFQNYSLSCWDHKTHIRIAYTNLKKYGREEGAAKIRQGIQDFIANSTITNKNRFHETMTRFWVTMTLSALIDAGTPLTWESYDDEGGLKQFDSFLESNQHLMNGGLFLKYYSRELMLNNMESRQKFMFPDIAALPITL